jgi:hypothetical protein
MLKPSERMALIMAGKAPVDPDLAPMVDRECYLVAIQVIRTGDTKEKRASMLARIPQAHRVAVETHIRRLWEKREDIKRNRYF